MGSILIRGAKLADPEKICCERLDLLCRNGVIEKIEKKFTEIKKKCKNLRKKSRIDVELFSIKTRKEMR